MAASLVAELEALRQEGLTEKKKKLLWTTEHAVPLEQPLPVDGHSSNPPESSHTAAAKAKKVHLTSWHMQDYAYKRDPCPFPTRARGLFTSQDRIVLRGYDKFFNVGEVSWTKWENVNQHAHGPFHLTVKSNGCLILISALSPTQLIITSKHALSTHAEWGHAWVRKSLAAVKTSEAALAHRLYHNDWTAVAELCDDSFEEHVLAYKPEETGLHLHGINLNQPHLRTLPPDQVNAFAREFGFIETKYLTLDSLDQVRSFADACEADNGRWNGQHVEGFVIRAPAKDGSNDPLSTFMFKAKFDQPYLRWREWRELTRRVLGSVRKEAHADTNKDVQATINKLREHQHQQQAGTVFGVNIAKIQHPDTKEYVLWLIDQVEHDFSQFDEWQQGRGIVRTRERFLEWLNSQPPEKRFAAMSVSTNGGGATDERPFDRTMIVPVAVPGCGKTLMANALTGIFGFAHTQSDDVQAKQTKKQFLGNVVKLLRTEPVVIADRNNHQKLHRKDLVDAADKVSANRIRKVAMVFAVDKLPGNLVHRVCSDRIVARGERHQSLRADLESNSHEAILHNFLVEHEPFNAVLNGDSDGRYDEVIEVDPTLDSQEMLDQVIQRVTQVIPDLATPESSKVSQALEDALGYAPSLRKEAKAEPVKTRYFGIAVEADLLTFLESHFEDVPQALYHHLKAEGRVERRPHITLVHHKEVDSGDEQAKKTWDRATELTKRYGADAIHVPVQLGPKIAWNDRVMAIEALLMDGASEELEGVLRHRHSFHITVGTANRDVPAVEGKWLVEAMHRGESQTQDGLKVNTASVGTVQVDGRIKGLS